ncbi:hypothetical protein [Paenibacillus marchantiophytorum]|nr:hypothetical protein [Paenibacillus marchantiophytorum]
MATSLTKVATATAALTAGTAAIAGTAGAIKLVTESLKGASQIEQNTVAIEHFAGLTLGAEKAKEATKGYIDYLNQNANLTPFETGDVMNAGRRLINVTSGDMDGAKKLLTISENMAALNPGKSLMDAVEALADMKTGEFERMKEFGFKISAKDLEKAGGGTKGAMKLMMTDVAKTFEGGSDKLSKTALGSWSTITGTVQSGISQMGVKSLETIKPQLEKIARFLSNGGADKLFDAGSRLMARMFDGIITAAQRGWSYVQTRYLNNPEFLKIRDIPGKVTFVVDDLLQIFNTYMENTGYAKVESMTEKLTNALSRSIMDNAPKLIEPSLSLGAKIAEGITKGLAQALAAHPLGSAVLGAIAGGRFGGVYGAAIGAGAGVIGSQIADSYVDRLNRDKFFQNGGVNGWIDRSRGVTDQVTTSPVSPLITDPSDGTITLPNSVMDRFNSRSAEPNGHSAGLSRVPYDNYPARLHEGETVLRKSEADSYRNGGGGGGNITVTGNTFNVRAESDIDAIAKALATQAWEARGAVVR